VPSWDADHDTIANGIANCLINTGNHLNVSTSCSLNLQNDDFATAARCHAHKIDSGNPARRFAYGLTTRLYGPQVCFISSAGHPEIINSGPCQAQYCGAVVESVAVSHDGAAEAGWKHILSQPNP